MNSYKNLLNVIFVGIICNFQCLMAAPNNMPDLKIETFGSHLDSEEISDGFLFIGNEYIDAPYKVTSKGLGIFVNDRLVDRIHLPPYYGLEDADPIMPTNITENTSIYDPVYKKYMKHKFAFINKNYPNQHKEKKIEAYQNLPNIKKIDLDNNPNYITIHTFIGESIRGNIAMHGRRVKTDLNSITQRVEGKRQQYERRLKRGSVTFVARNGGMKRIFAKNPKKLSAILKLRNKNIANLPLGKQQLEAQSKEIAKFGLDLQPDFQPNLLTNFVASPQLDERVQELLLKEEAKTN